MITLKIASILIALLFLAIYTVYVINKFGIPDSYSKTYYDLPNKKRWIFILFIFGISLPAIIFTIDPFRPILLLGIVMIASVGVFAMYKKKIIEEIHIICASGGIILSFLDLLLYDFKHMLIPAILMIIFMITYGLTGKKTAIFWIELWATCIIYSSLIFLTYYYGS